MITCEIILRWLRDVKDGKKWTQNTRHLLDLDRREHVARIKIMSEQRGPKTRSLNFFLIYRGDVGRHIEHAQVSFNGKFPGTNTITL